LYSTYESAMELNVPFSNEAFLGTEVRRIGTFDRAFIESTGSTQVFRTQKEIKKISATQPGIPVPVEGYQERVLSEGWVRA